MKKYKMFYLKTNRTRKALDSTFFAASDKHAINKAKMSLEKEYFGNAKLLNIFREEKGNSIAIIRR